MLPFTVVVVLAFASYRATRLLTADTITASLREALYEFAWDVHRMVTNPQTGELEPAAKAPWRTHLYDFATCAWCVGVWVSLGAVWAWLGRFPDSWHAWVTVTAVAGGQGFLASRAET